MGLANFDIYVSHSQAINSSLDGPQRMLGWLSWSGRGDSQLVVVRGKKSKAKRILENPTTVNFDLPADLSRGLENLILNFFSK